ncbi:bacteriohemerythrin [Desulfopila sp. IMCC35008]|uniref:bacteriohemerythrin n=1 Tax=Desulfopila sp. IMCC35008 TaxID=2653858 RepID=UPI0013D507A7|nr:bacteriohemerythrin [Desulfopila sp. IMCC35008]
MEIIKWRESYNIGIESMDLQHKLIIELINKLYNMIRQEESSTMIAEILEEMKIYAEEHFREEESLLETHKYPALSEHRDQHQVYREKLQDLLINNDEAIMDTYTFLRKWWTEHIMNEDKQYSEFLAQ